MSGVGRPAGSTSATAELAHKLYELRRDYRVPVSTLVENTGMSQARVYELLKAARDSDAAARAESRPHPFRVVGADGVPGGDAPSVAPAPAKPPRRLTERALLFRAWFVTGMDLRLQRASAETKLFWLKAVLAIGTIGDGSSLRFEQCGFDGRAEFCADASADESQLTLLLRRRLLDEVEGGIALPRNLGLTPKERIGGSLIPSFPGMGAPPARRGKAPDARQAWMPLPLVGGTAQGSAGDSRWNGSGGGNGQASFGPEKDSGSMPFSQNRDSGIDPGSAIYPESFSDAHAAAAAAKNQVYQSLSSSSSSLGTDSALEKDSGSIAGLPESDSGSIAANIPDPASVLATELCGLAGIARPPSADDLEHVRRWLAAGRTPGTLRALVRDKAPKAKRPPMQLSYFHPIVVDLVAPPAPAVPPIAASPPSAKPALSPEDQALHNRLEPSYRAGWDRPETRPRGASLEAWKEAAAAGVDVERWLAVWTAWNAAGAAQDRKPPNFGMWRLQRGQFERTLRDVEEVLTAPAPDTTP